MIRSKFQFDEVKISIRKVIYNSGRNINKNGDCKVYIEIIAFYEYKKRKTRRIPTDVYVKPIFWESKEDDGRVSIKDPDHILKNTKINRVFGKYMVQLEEREMGTWSENFDKKNLVSIDDMFPQKTKSLTDFIDDYIAYRKSVNTPRGTLKEFTTCKNRIIKYEKHINKNLKFGDINLKFSDDFYSFLLSENYSEGTIHKTYSILITILYHYYERRDEYNINLSDKFRSKQFKRGKPSENDPKPLSKIELKTLIDHTFDSSDLNRLKERFLFQVSTGIRYSDMFSITVDNIKDECIVYQPQKTRHKRDNWVIVPLNPLSSSILDAYGYDMNILKLSNQKYNQGLKKMFNKLIEDYPQIYKTTYTSHNGRDTFITNALESGIDVPTILRMVGQSSYRVMKRYTKLSDKHIKEKMAMVSEYDVTI